MARWSIAVFAKDEEETVSSCLASVDAAAAGVDSGLTVIVNGSTDRTIERVARYREGRRPDLRLYRAALASKANAWNQFIHDFRPDADFYFFVDAYARVEPDAFIRLCDALERNPHAHAATAVPSTGRSAAAMSEMFMRHGGLHGTLHVLRRDFVEEIARRGIRQPFGLYRGDGLIGAVAMYDFDARRHEWDKSRVAVVGKASWSHRPLSPIRIKDLKRHFNRMVMQARGRLENAAVGEVIHSGGFEALPEHADTMIRNWLAHQPRKKIARLCCNPLTALAMQRLCAHPPPSGMRLEAVPDGACS